MSEEQVAPSPDVHFEPIVKLPLVEIKTLEEDEEVLFQVLSTECISELKSRDNGKPFKLSTYANMPGKDILALGCVSRRFYKMMVPDSFWRYLCLKKYELNINTAPRIAYMHLLKPFKNLIGYWQSDIPTYGGFMKIELENGRLLGYDIKHRASNSFNWTTERISKKIKFVIYVDRENQLQIICVNGGGKLDIDIHEPSKITLMCSCDHKFYKTKYKRDIEYPKTSCELTQILFRIKYAIIRYYTNTCCAYRKLPEYFVELNVFSKDYFLITVVTDDNTIAFS